MSITRTTYLAVLCFASFCALAPPAAACAGLVTPSGNIRVLRTSTLAAYHDGVEHYVTAFTFQGEGASLGSLVPLPAVPESIERGGDWTLQRLEREAESIRSRRAANQIAVATRSAPVEVLQQVRVDALDLTVLRGGGPAVAEWAAERGFTLTPDAPEVLDFYAARTPIFLAAVFDAEAARARGQEVGEGTPVHITIPTNNPWVPLRILTLGRPAEERVDANVYLLTDNKPALLAGIGGLEYVADEPASPGLLADLRDDTGMEWVPESMWFTALKVDGVARDLTYDLAIDTTGTRSPSFVAAGLEAPRAPMARGADGAAPLRATTPFAVTAHFAPADAALGADSDGAARSVPAPLLLLPLVAAFAVGWKLRGGRA